jgi:hypothetical protein
MEDPGHPFTGWAKITSRPVTMVRVVAVLQACRTARPGRRALSVSALTVSVRKARTVGPRVVRPATARATTVVRAMVSALGPVAAVFGGG